MSLGLLDASFCKALLPLRLGQRERDNLDVNGRMLSEACLGMAFVESWQCGKVGMVGTTDRNNLWLLCREPAMELHTLQKLRDHAKKYGDAAASQVGAVCPFLSCS